MPIDFHHEDNGTTYTARDADASWMDFIQSHVEVSGKRAADIGCGGGIYTRALVKLGAAQVTAVDFSAAMLAGASALCRDVEHAVFQQGEAYNTGLAGEAFELVLERALIHHVDDLERCFREANRILKCGGMLIVQDRTPQDCLLPGDEHHLRGYFFEKYPELAAAERSRRHAAEAVHAALDSSGFAAVREVQFWETRRDYADWAALQTDLAQRTGRSILHELTDEELSGLIAFIGGKLESSPAPIVEKDRWTLWFAVKR
ncbi:class I SAM-dependent methyltransferase [Paenibacillus sp. NFR01]|uniref:class I SAM-dependent methyltransferase n=1 Tax=Paenibacillus sp. NFR01 TaxID=1566279 RepID=UPI0008C4F4D8|nr:class I SAM-dependent methyltransferase [Paenibacillus sp. NFR01]SET38314.1 Methyltransferase domain-containing protein [Paenibacillus sp. NFR01]